MGSTRNEPIRSHGFPCYPRLTRSDPRQEAVLDDTSTALDQELPALASLAIHLFELFRIGLQFLPDHVVQHDDVGPGLQRFGCFVIRLTLDGDQEGEPSGSAARPDSFGDRAGSPNVVVLEHDHAAEIVTVRIDTTDHHAVLFDESEPGRRLARPGDLALPAGLTCEVTESFRAGGSRASTNVSAIVR